MNDVSQAGDARRPAGTSEPDEFQLPLHGLFADLELGRGSIRLGKDFHDCSSLVKLQLLRDWQRSLAQYRHDAMTQFAKELTGHAPDLEPEQRLALFRSTCATLHIDVPSGFDVLTTVP